MNIEDMGKIMARLIDYQPHVSKGSAIGETIVTVRNDIGNPLLNSSEFVESATAMISELNLKDVIVSDINYDDDTDDEYEYLNITFEDI